MEPNETNVLVRLAQRRFRNFSEAAELVLEALSEVTPGVVALSRLEPGHRTQQVIEARGDGLNGLEPGTAMPSVAGGVDADVLHNLGANSWLSIPLEISDGRTVGALFAADTGSEAYGTDHAALVGVGARLLSHEWESVVLRSELRRLRERIDGGSSTDSDTGLPDRETFLELLDQEWRLVEEEAVEAVLVVCGLSYGGESDNGVTAKDRLAMKQVAEVLRAAARGTDHVGRIGGRTLGAILVGCELQDTPAFVARFLGALQRVTDGSQPETQVSCGVQPLAGAPSAQVALDLAEAAAQDHGQIRNRELEPQALE